MDWEKFVDLSVKDAPRMLVTPPGPRSLEILKIQEELEGSAVSYPRGMPMALARGRGATLEDVDGNVYIDCFSGAGVMALGHAHPFVLEAAHGQLDKVTHTLDIPSETRMRLVKILGRILPAELSRVFFGGPTGSDAVEQAIKLARFNTRRDGIIVFEGAYHGMTGASLAATSDSGHKDGIGSLAPGFQFLPFPYRYRNPFGCPEEKVDEFAADNLERVLDDTHSGYSKPAAVLLEAVQGEGGTIIPGPLFLQRVREITEARGILLICDEIQCGLGRTGKMFAFEHSGIVPDIVTMSKALGGAGFPISAIAFREELNTLPPGKSIGTFRGNMVAFAAGAAGLEWMIENRVPEYAAQLGEKAMARFREMEKGSRILGEARGIGLMIALEIVEDKKTRKPAGGLTKQLRKLAHQRGVMIEVGGHHNNVARLLPPLVISEAHLMKAADILEGVLKELE
ncbi:MAG TPA: aspartate aminotransferase family protein [Synergistales bacterium]|nr:aspartate aminotransferase family protein [Synergistales bacterium]HPK42309.1 aspartate aminotransferase family protein [Synergistales bacterium]